MTIYINFKSCFTIHVYLQNFLKAWVYAGTETRQQILLSVWIGESRESLFIPQEVINLPPHEWAGKIAISSGHESISLKGTWRSWTFPPGKSTRLHEPQNSVSPVRTRRIPGQIEYTAIRAYVQECGWILAHAYQFSFDLLSVAMIRSRVQMLLKTRPSTSSLWILIDISGIFQESWQLHYIHPVWIKWCRGLPPTWSKWLWVARIPTIFIPSTWQTSFKIPSTSQQGSTMTHSFDSMSPITYTTFLIFLEFKTILLRGFHVFVQMCSPEATVENKGPSVCPPPAILHSKFSSSTSPPNSIQSVPKKRELNELSDIILSY